MRYVPAFRLIVLLAASSVAAYAARTLDIYFIDVEGGQSTLVVSPSGQSLLIDTGYAGNSGRDANRIAQAAKLGGVENLLARLSVTNFLDKGPSVEENGKYPEPYEKAFASGQHKVVTPGEK